MNINEYYNKVNDTFSKRKEKTINTHRELFQNTCYWLGFQYWLDNEIGNATERYPNKWKNLQKQVGHSFYVRNLHYLYGSIELSSIGLVDPCMNLLRTVYESILKMYYLALFPS